MTGWAPCLQRLLVKNSLNKQRIIRDRHDPRDLYSDLDFKRKFRFRKQSLDEIVQWIGPKVFTLTNHHYAVPGLIRLCMFLRFMGSGAHYNVIGDTHGIVKSTVHNIVHHFVKAVASKSNEMVVFPRELDELSRIKCGFHRIGGKFSMLPTMKQGHLPCNTLKYLDCMQNFIFLLNPFELYFTKAFQV